MIGTLKHADSCEACGRAIAAGETVRGVPIGGGWAFECRECAQILTFGPFPVIEEKLAGWVGRHVYGDGSPDPYPRDRGSKESRS